MFLELRRAGGIRSRLLPLRSKSKVLGPGPRGPVSYGCGEAFVRLLEEAVYRMGYNALSMATAVLLLSCIRLQS